MLSGGVVLLAVMAERMFGFEVGPRQWMGVGLTAAGLFLLVITLPAIDRRALRLLAGRHDRLRGRLLVLGGLLIAGPRIGGPEQHHGVMLGAAAGILFGVSDIAIKAITGIVGSGGLVAALSAPGSSSRSSPRSSPSTPRRAASRTARPSRSSP